MLMNVPPEYTREDLDKDPGQYWLIPTEELKEMFLTLARHNAPRPQAGVLGHAFKAMTTPPAESKPRRFKERKT